MSYVLNDYYIVKPFRKLCVCVCVQVPEGHRRVGSLELALLTIMCCPTWMLGTELESSAGAECVLNH